MHPIIVGGRLPCPTIVEEVKTVDDMQFVKVGLKHRTICRFLFGKQRVFEKSQGVQVFETMRDLRTVATSDLGSDVPETSVLSNGLLDLGLNAPSRKRKFSDEAVVEISIGDWVFNVLSNDNRRHDVWMELTGANLDKLYSAVDGVSGAEVSATSDDAASTTTASPWSDDSKASTASGEINASTESGEGRASTASGESKASTASDESNALALPCELVSCNWAAKKRRWIVRFRSAASGSKAFEKVFTPDRSQENIDPIGARARCKVDVDAWIASNLQPQTQSHA
jgi:hypothetical protein